MIIIYHILYIYISYLMHAKKHIYENNCMHAGKTILNDLIYAYASIKIQINDIELHVCAFMQIFTMV